MTEGAHGDWSGVSLPTINISSPGGKEGKMSNAITTQAKRRLERRELKLYYAVGFVLFLPLVFVDRAVDSVRGRMNEHRGSVIQETHAKVSGMLGFVYMA